MTPPEHRRTPRDEGSPTGDLVTARELHGHLGSVYRRIDEVDVEVTNVRVDFERRLGRMERLIWVLAAAVASPKVGGPDIPHLAGTVLVHLAGQAG